MTIQKKRKPRKSANKSRRDTNSATALLAGQHREVEAMFKKIEGGRGDREAMVSELASDLAAHMHIEQEIFYPAVKRFDEDLIFESFEEHAGAETALRRLLATDPEDETFDAKVSVLKELIRHHVEEEEGELFPKVEKKMSSDENRTLGEHMKQVFEQVVKRGHASSLPEQGRVQTTADIAERRLLSQAEPGEHVVH